MLHHIVVVAQLLNLVTVLPHVSTSCLNVLVPHGLDRLFSLLELLLENLQLDSIIGQGGFLIVETLFKFGELLTDPLFVCFEESNFLAVHLI